VRKKPHLVLQVHEELVPLHPPAMLENEDGLCRQGSRFRKVMTRDRNGLKLPMLAGVDPLERRFVAARTKGSVIDEVKGSTTPSSRSSGA
jgi:hypothetical protein